MGRCFGKVRRNFNNGLGPSGLLQTQQAETRPASGAAARKVLVD